MSVLTYIVQQDLGVPEEERGHWAQHHHARVGVARDGAGAVAQRHEVPSAV